MISKLPIWLIFIVCLAGCATTPVSGPSAPNFLPNSNLLHFENKSNHTNEIYRYLNQQFKHDDYHGYLLEPLALYTTIACKERLLSAIRTASRDSLGTRLHQVDKAGPGVLRVKIAITGAKLDPSGSFLQKLIPLESAISLATRGTSQVGANRVVLIIEVKIQDSQSGELIAEAFEIIQSPILNGQNSESSRFQSLTQEWIKTTLKTALAS